MACDYLVWMKPAIYAHLAETPCNFEQLHFPWIQSEWTESDNWFGCGNVHCSLRLIFNIPDMKYMPTYLPPPAAQSQPAEIGVKMN